MRALRLFALTLLLLSPRGAPLFAEKIRATSFVDRNPIGLGEKIYLSIDVTYPEVEKVEVVKAKWPDGLTLLSGPTIRSFSDPGDEFNPRKVRIRYVFRGERLGRLVVDPISIRAGGARIETEAFVVGVGYWRNREIFIPLQCRWRIDAESAVVGQTIRAVLVLRDMIEIPVVENVSVPQTAGALIEEVTDIGPLERAVAGDQVVYQLPVAAYLVTPSRSGRLTLPSARVEVAGEIVKTDPASIVVLPLPADAATYGAVGAFRFSVHIPQQELSVGDEIEFGLRVEGTGNLNYLDLPEPSLEKLVLANTKTVSDFRADYEGYTGAVEKRYRVVAQESGVASIVIPAFSWFDPAKQTVIEVGARRTRYEVAERPDGTKTEDEFPFSLETVDEALSRAAVDSYRNPANYLWLIPGLVAVLVLALLKKAKIILVALTVVLIAAGEPQRDVEVERAISIYRDGGYATAAALFLAATERFPERPGLLYNASLSHYRAGDYLESVVLIRRAIDMDPGSRRYRAFAEWVNARRELPRVVYPSAPVDVDLFFFLFMGFMFIATAFLILQMLRSRGLFVIIVVLALLSGSASLGAVVVLHLQNGRPTAIVVEETPMRTIPNAAATVRSTMPTGVSVRVVDDAGDFSLVVNGAGATGWIPSASLLLD